LTDHARSETKPLVIVSPGLHPSAVGANYYILRSKGQVHKFFAVRIELRFSINNLCYETLISTPLMCRCRFTWFVSLRICVRTSTYCIHFIKVFLFESELLHNMHDKRR